MVFVLVAAATCGVVSAARGPALDGWRSLRADGSPAGLPISDLVGILTGGCALLLALAWLWLAAAVAACTWEALRDVPVTDGLVRSSVLRPRLVRTLVTGFLGVSTLVGPAAQAHAPVTPGHALPDDLGAGTLSTATATRSILDGLPVPDRVAGTARRVSPGGRSGTAPSVPPPQPAPARLEVVAGDSLWSLTAGLLPTGAPASTVATGWRLLYAANREVIGSDPDLLRPGQTLLVGPSLAVLVEAGRDHLTGRAPQPFSPDSGGPR